MVAVVAPARQPLIPGATSTWGGLVRL